jgi:PadR family transcriptional regulator
MGEFLGEFEQLVLLAVARQGDDAYGVSIRQEIADKAERQASLGAVYVTLDRLEAKGFVVSHRGEPTKERGGRAKRVFRLTAEGERALARSQRAIAQLSKGLRLRWN